MYYVILIALASFYAIVYLLSKKAQSIELGQTFITRGYTLTVLRQFENRLELSYNQAKRWAKRLEVSTYNFLLFALNRFMPWYRKVTEAIEHKLEEFTQMIQGRQVLRERGSSSLFLRDIAEHKKRRVHGSRKLKVFSVKSGH